MSAKRIRRSGHIMPPSASGINFDPITLYFSGLRRCSLLSEKETIALGLEIRHSRFALRNELLALPFIREKLRTVFDHSAQNPMLLNDVLDARSMINGNNTVSRRDCQRVQTMLHEFLWTSDWVRRLRASASRNGMRSVLKGAMTRNLRAADRLIVQVDMHRSWIQELTTILETRKTTSSLTGLKPSRLRPIIRRILRIESLYDEAVQLFAEKNAKLVVSVARRYFSPGMHFLDLIQEGNIGLIEAVMRWDPTYGCKFSTFATHWIKQGVLRAVAKNQSIIRTPMHVAERMKKVSDFVDAFVGQHGYTPSPTEVAKALGIRQSVAEQVMRVLDFSFRSFNAPSEDGQREKLANTIEDLEAVDIIAEADVARLHEIFRRLLRPPEFSQRDIRILHLRYGFDGHPRSLEEVGGVFNISRERVRQLEERALCNLRILWHREERAHRIGT